MSAQTHALDVIRALRGRLAAAGIESAAREAELLVQHVLSLSRAEVFGENPALREGQIDLLEDLIDRRAAGEPLQYLMGRQSFRSLELEVGPGVLVPRPETEILVERALGLLRGLEKPLVADIGCGSGAIALSIAMEHPGARVYATEVSPEAMRWAERNLGSNLEADVFLGLGDMFDPIPPELKGKFDLVVSNPPYLSEQEIAEAPADVRDHEPAIATVAGPTGLEVSARLASAALDWLRPGGNLLLETHPGQAARLETLLSSLYADVTTSPDLSGHLRVIGGAKPPYPPPDLGPPR